MANNHNLRGVFWGDSPENVEETEKWDRKTSFVVGSLPLEALIEFEGICEDQSCKLTYAFWKNTATEKYELWRILYNFKRQPPQNARDLLSKIERKLRMKYGDPAKDCDEQPPDRGQRLRWLTHYKNEGSYIQAQTVIDLYCGTSYLSHQH